MENVSFTINEGEIYGLIGPNGAGKTTTIRSILGMLKINEGEIYLDRYKIPEDIDKVKDNIGYVPSEVFLYEEMKVKEFIEFNRKFYKNIDKTYSQWLIDYLEIDVSKKIKELSHGNKKKLAIFQAFVHNPKYLILDEATNGLDPLLQQKIYDLVENHRNKGAVILFSSHILSEVEKLCQRFGMIKDGVIIKEGKIKELKELEYKVIHLKGLNCNDSEILSIYLAEKMPETSIFHVPYENLKDFISQLSNCDFEDIEIKDPTLEDVFLKLYE